MKSVTKDIAEIQETVAHAWWYNCGVQMIKGVGYASVKIKKMIVSFSAEENVNFLPLVCD